MPDQRRHRGAHPEDGALFAPSAHAVLRTACGELSWLLSRGYPVVATTALVGDRHRLVERQRIAVRRAACSDRARSTRIAQRVAAGSWQGREVWVDGFNVLVTAEAALAGGVLLRCRDGALRDMASMHGSYRRMEETDAALDAVAATLRRHHVASARWLFDRPVSNSGRLAERLRARNEPGWTVEVVEDPDRVLAEAPPPGVIVATADAGILDRGPAALDLAGHVVAELESRPAGQLVDFTDS